MSSYISIGATQNTDLIKVKLYRQLKLLEKKGFKVFLEENYSGNFTFLSCGMISRDLSLYSDEETSAILKHYIADIISDLILNQWERSLLEEIIRENYYFDAEEREAILQQALHHVGHGTEMTGYESLGRVRRKNRVLRKIIEFLHNNNQIIIEGFIRFRLKEYMNELEEAVEKAVDDFLLEREYKEFVQLLKYFVEIQNPQIDLVHIVFHPAGVFKLFDRYEQTINTTSMEELFWELAESDLNYEDLLFNILVSLAPKQIIIHSGKSKHPPVALQTIKNVFLGRVEECSGCDLCCLE